ncbi:uncharacterized protein BXZ73DRAFT_91123 [Epithele typhae]|uniref:uncharacterized protein n=1 Tax=Epithele typhae TaxID=378194 RepID=UPI0020083324|nr:uncharacterized protein BXZ73DRAFT_91123 [Epithele typhae]KAH9925405.1 hypothetical protein BXZ73DRAFT_91123 [Epithele typhae]
MASSPPPPAAPPSSPSAVRYTCEVAFHRASNVLISDLGSLSADPYIVATLSPLAPAEAVQSVHYRTPTAHRTRDPVFDGARWVVAGVPASGFVLAMDLFDEDRGSRDDRLGRAVVRFPPPTRGVQEAGEGATGAALREGWNSGEREVKVRKRHGDLRARVKHHTRVVVSVRVLGRSPQVGGEEGRRCTHLGRSSWPDVFSRHFSPLAARLASVQTFKATEVQLQDRPFVKAMFRARGIQGVILNYALHKQHRAIYNWDKNTIRGIAGDTPATARDGDAANGETDGQGKADEAFVRKFLQMAEYGREGRVFTYVITLDGQWRFTETGEEFAIQFLSKHTMHSDVAIEIAYSGEFFVRRAQHGHERHDDTAALQNGDSPAPANDSPPGPCNGNAQPPKPSEGTTDPDHDEHRDGDGAGEEECKDEDEDELSLLPPSAFELVIDNDSGTYRPQKELLPVLEAFLARPENLGALGRVRAMDGFDERLKRWKEERHEERRRVRGGGGGGQGARAGVVRQASRLRTWRAGGGGGAEAVGDEAGAREQQAKVVAEDARRARDNEDEDEVAKEEELDEGVGMGRGGSGSFKGASQPAGR